VTYAPVKPGSSAARLLAGSEPVASSKTGGRLVDFDSKRVQLYIEPPSTHHFNRDEGVNAGLIYSHGQASSLEDACLPSYLPARESRFITEPVILEVQVRDLPTSYVSP